MSYSVVTQNKGNKMTTKNNVTDLVNSLAAYAEQFRNHIPAELKSDYDDFEDTLSSLDLAVNQITSGEVSLED